MNRLSLKQAIRCETAQGDVCKCRCGGVLHGKMRMKGAFEPALFFSMLPKDDPHYRPLTNAEARHISQKLQYELPF